MRDIDEYPKSIFDLRGASQFLLGIIFNQGIKAKLAWRAPSKLFSRLDINSIEDIAHLPIEQIESALRSTPALHRFPGKMAEYSYKSAVHCLENYNGDPRKIWIENRSPQTLLKSFIAVPGIGEHKAIVAIATLNLRYELDLLYDGKRFNLSEACPRLSSKYSLNESEIFY